MDVAVTPIALSTAEAARCLRMSRANLYRLFASGELKYAKIGGRTLVRKSDLEELLERSMQGGTDNRTERAPRARSAG